MQCILFVPLLPWEVHGHVSYSLFPSIAVLSQNMFSRSGAVRIFGLMGHFYITIAVDHFWQSTACFMPHASATHYVLYLYERWYMPSVILCQQVCVAHANKMTRLLHTSIDNRDAGFSAHSGLHYICTWPVYQPLAMPLVGIDTLNGYCTVLQKGQ